MIDEVIVGVAAGADLDQFVGGVDEDFGIGGPSGMVVAEGCLELELAVEVDLNKVLGAGAAEAVPAWVADAELGLYLVALHLLDFGDPFSFARRALGGVAIGGGIGLNIGTEVVDPRPAAQLLPTDHDARQLRLGLIANEVAVNIRLRTGAQGEEEEEAFECRRHGDGWRINENG